MKYPDKIQELDNTNKSKREPKKHTREETRIIDKTMVKNELFGIDIIEYARENYNNDYLPLLTIEKDNLTKEVLDILETCRSITDGRTTTEYGAAILLSWITEDLLLKDLQEKIGDKAEIELNGIDKERKLIDRKELKSNTDLILKINGKKYYIEVVEDYTQYWDKYEKMDFRDTKLEKLVNSSMEYDGVFILGLSLKDKKIGLIKIEPDKKYDLSQTYNFFMKRRCQTLMIDYDNNFVKFKNSADIYNKLLI